MLDGRAQPTGIRKRGEDATMLLIYNAWHDMVEFKLPSVSGPALETDDRYQLSDRKSTRNRFCSGQNYAVTGRSFLMFELVPGSHG